MEKPKQYTIHLEWYEIERAAMTGVRREVESIKAGHRNVAGFSGNFSWQRAIEGACGELAFAKFFKTYWQGSINTFRNGGDVGKLQIKTIGLEDHHLIIKDRDPKDAIYVLVIGKLGEYRIAGWIRDKDARRKEWYTTHVENRPPAYHIPQEALRSIDELVEMRNKKYSKALLGAMPDQTSDDTPS